MREGTPHDLELSSKSARNRHRIRPQRNEVEEMRELEDFDASLIDSTTLEIVERWLAESSGLQQDEHESAFEAILAPLQQLEEQVHSPLIIDHIAWHDGIDIYSLHVTYKWPPITAERVSACTDEDLQAIAHAIPVLQGLKHVPTSWVDGFDIDIGFDGLLTIWLEDGKTNYELTDDELILLIKLLSE